jgi:hypothetical protein
MLLLLKKSLEIRIDKLKLINNTRSGFIYLVFHKTLNRMNVKQ